MNAMGPCKVAWTAQQAGVVKMKITFSSHCPNRWRVDAPKLTPAYGINSFGTIPATKE
jgi:hypothetical protein